MSRRKTVRVAQLEGRADAFAAAREALCWRIEEMFRSPAVSAQSVRSAVEGRLFAMEIEALREMTKAQRAQEEA